MLGVEQPSTVLDPCAPKIEVLTKFTLAPKQAVLGAVKTISGLGKICTGVIAS